MVVQNVLCLHVGYQSEAVQMAISCMDQKSPADSKIIREWYLTLDVYEINEGKCQVNGKGLVTFFGNINI